MIGALLLAVLGACPVDRPLADPPAERARQALAAAPERPGLALAFGQRLLDAGAADDAEACAESVLTRWPDAVRARLLLARVALARGDRATADRLLADVEAHGPAPAVLEARRIRGALPPPPTPAAGRFGARVALGAHYDNRAAVLAAVDDPLPASADPAALRGAFTGELGYVHAAGRRLWRARVGLDRTVHAVTREPVEAGPLDRTALWADGQYELGAGGDRFGVGAELRGTLAGRLGEPHHAALGLLAWWRRPRAPLAPWARLRSYGFAFADSAGREPREAWTELAVGARARRGLLALDGRLGAQWLTPGPDAFYGLGADLRPELSGRYGAVYLVGGVGWRQVERGAVIAPRAGLGVHLPIGDRYSIGADAIWQRAAWLDDRGAPVDRYVAGLVAEVRL